jgi:glycerophosphoryl diester phosphodiesterase
MIVMACLPWSAGQADPLVVFHRGSTTDEPENTLRALAWAVEAGAQAIEVDLRVTVDGHIVVIHGENVAKTTNGRGRLHRMSFASVRALDAGDGERVPTLDEVLTFASSRSFRLLLDVKDPERTDARELVGRLTRRGLGLRSTIGSRSPEFLREVRRADPKLEVLAFVPDRASIADFLALDVDVIRLWASWIDRSPGLVSEVQEAGAAVWVNTRAMEGARLGTMLASGVDGVITDRPLEALALESGSNLIATD